MRAYKRIAKFSILIAIISLLIAILLNFCFVIDKTGFWTNVCLGVFGSATLTILTSVVSYFHEKRQTLENFVYHTRQILSYLNKYQESMSLEQKLKFYLDYHDLDKSAWDMDIGNMDFFFENKTHDFQYIYTAIYKPILDFNRAVENHVWHFRWYLDGTGKNDTVMEKFLLELQEYLLEKNEQDIPTEKKCLSPAKKYKVYKSSINKSIHFAQRRLSNSTRVQVQRVTAQLNLSRE